MSEQLSGGAQFEDVFETNENREADWQYHELLERILSEGRTAQSGMDEASREIIGHQMRFDMSNGYPMITERDLMASSLPENISSWQPDASERQLRMSARQGVGEILGFINGARTLEELESYGCKWWKAWVTPEKTAKRGLPDGDLGYASYGAAFHDFPMADGETFNQFDAVLQQMRERPELRTHLVTPFIPYGITRSSEHMPDGRQGVVVAPCHGQLHFNLDTVSGEFDLVHWQRSADVPVGLPFNMLHYSTLMAMVGHVTGYKPRELVYQISNAHIYKRHYEIVEEILARSPREFPKLKLDTSVGSLFDFRVEHFIIEEYNPHPPMNMGGTAV